MEISTNIVDKKAFVTIKGSISALTADEFNAEVNKFINDIDELEFDFKEVDYISSAGLRVLVAAQTILEDNKIVIKNVSELVREVFRITSFDNVFDIL